MRLNTLDRNTDSQLGSPFTIDWDFGTELMKEILDAIGYVSRQKPPFKVETEGYKVYWAGTILRVDINRTELE